MVKVKEDITGWKMWEHGVPDSRLIVIKQIEDYVSSGGKRESQWLCECSCEAHNTIKLKGSKIKNGRTRSCGCLRKETVTLLHSKTNNYSKKLYDEYGEYYIGYTLNTNKAFYIDAEDYIKIKEHCWSENHVGVTSTIVATINNKTITMHQFLGFSSCDHSDRNELNNRKYNLRPCTSKQNSQNRNRRSDNLSGFIGVGWHKQRQKWRARITIDGFTKHLGDFVDKKDAIKIRLLAEQKYFGEFAPQRHLFEQYGITI